jgi:hypothetical protein
LRQIVTAARARAEELGVAGAVIWAGRVDELLPYYRLADVYVTASLHEGFGVPLIEAMACGVPVVASRAGAMPWVLGNAGLLCKPGDAADLAAQVLRVLQDAALRYDLVERGLRRAQDLSLENYQAGLAEIVDRAVVYTLPGIPPEFSASVGEEKKTEPVSPSVPDQSLLGELTHEIEAHSDVALRGYVVSSKAPLVGPQLDLSPARTLSGPHDRAASCSEPAAGRVAESCRRCIGRFCAAAGQLGGPRPGLGSAG